MDPIDFQKRIEEAKQRAAGVVPAAAPIPTAAQPMEFGNSGDFAGGVSSQETGQAMNQPAAMQYQQQPTQQPFQQPQQTWSAGNYGPGPMAGGMPMQSMPAQQFDQYGNPMPHPHMQPQFPPQQMQPPAAQQPAPAAQGQDVVPTLPPQDPALQERIEKMADYVARNGPEFAALARQREQGNPEFAFLYGGPEHAYYNWVVHCQRMGFAPEQRLQWAREYAQGMHQAPPPPPPQQQQAPLGGGCAPQPQEWPDWADGEVPPEYYRAALTPADQAGLEEVVRRLDGTKDAVRAGKLWVAARPPYAWAAALWLRAYVAEVAAEAPGTANRAGVADGFTKLLHLVYLLNDVFFSAASGEGPPAFARLCLRHLLPPLARAAHALAPEQDQKDRVGKVLALWGDKGVYTPGQVEELKAGLEEAEAPPAPEDWPLGPPPPGPELQPVLLPSQQMEQQQQQHQQMMMMGMVPQQPMMMSTQQQQIMSRPQHAGSRWGTGMMSQPAPTPEAATTAFPVGGLSAVSPQVNASTGVVGGTLDAATVPVGVLVSLVKVALKAGHREYRPLNLKALPPAAPPHIEPGRLEVIVEQYYRKLEGDVQKELDRGLGGEDGERRERDGGKDRERERDRDRDQRRDRDREGDRRGAEPIRDWRDIGREHRRAPRDRGPRRDYDDHQRRGGGGGGGGGGGEYGGRDRDRQRFLQLEGGGLGVGGGPGGEGGGGAPGLGAEAMGQEGQGGLGYRADPQQGGSGGGVDDAFDAFRSQRSNTYHDRVMGGGGGAPRHY